MSIVIDFPARALADRPTRSVESPAGKTVRAASDGTKPYAPGVTLRENSASDIYFGTADALIAAGLVGPNQFPGLPNMRKTVVTIYADGGVANGAPTAHDRRAKEPGAKRIKRESKSAFSVRVALTKAISDIRWRAYKDEIDLAKEKSARFLYEATQGESYFLTHLYQHGSEQAAVRLLKIAECGPDWDAKQSYLSLVYVTDAEIEFFRFMRQKGLVAAARQLMRSIGKPLPGEEAGWGHPLANPCQVQAFKKYLPWRRNFIATQLVLRRYAVPIAP